MNILDKFSGLSVATCGDPTGIGACGDPTGIGACGDPTGIGASGSVNDLTQGLPAEIAAVKEQYEYYRNRLLSFNCTVATCGDCNKVDR